MLNKLKGGIKKLKVEDKVNKLKRLMTGTSTSLARDVAKHIIVGTLAAKTLSYSGEGIAKLRSLLSKSNKLKNAVDNQVVYKPEYLPQVDNQLPYTKIKHNKGAANLPYIKPNTSVSQNVGYQSIRTKQVNPWHNYQK